MRKLDRQVAMRILNMMSRVEALDDPRSVGEALHGDRLGNFWKYRVGDWRVITSIHDRILLVEVVEIDHRSRAYR